MDPSAQNQILSNVARSFSLSLLGLPHAQQKAVSTAYLMARLADSISDLGARSSEDRIADLQAWENAIFQRTEAKPSQHLLALLPRNERELVEAAPQLLNQFNNLNEFERTHVSSVLQTLIGTMRKELSISTEFICATNRDFEDYCYGIAGCVGAFWVRIFKLSTALENLAIDYGRGLQRINILRDVQEDWSRGKIYLSKEELLRRGFDLGRAPWTQPAWQKFVADYISETRAYLQEGLEFCNQIPRWQWKLRWASVMPAAIGFQTLSKLEQEAFWEKRVKVSRRELKRMAFRKAIDTVLGRRWKAASAA